MCFQLLSTLLKGVQRIQIPPSTAVESLIYAPGLQGLSAAGKWSVMWIDLTEYHDVMRVSIDLNVHNSTDLVSFFG